MLSKKESLHKKGFPILLPFLLTPWVLFSIIRSAVKLPHQWRYNRQAGTEDYKRHEEKSFPEGAMASDCRHWFHFDIHRSDRYTPEYSSNIHDSQTGS
jgi:hypothetical protein